MDVLCHPNPSLRVISASVVGLPATPWLCCSKATCRSLLVPSAWRRRLGVLLEEETCLVPGGICLSACPCVPAWSQWYATYGSQSKALTIYFVAHVPPAQHLRPFNTPCCFLSDFFLAPQEALGSSRGASDPAQESTASKTSPGASY